MKLPLNSLNQCVPAKECADGSRISHTSFKPLIQAQDQMLMRPSYILFIFIIILTVIDGMLYIHARQLNNSLEKDHTIQAIAVAGLGLTDLSVATEARYTRHPAVSDPMAPFMDHPGAIEHFPTGSFWGVPADFSQPRKSLP